MKDTPSRKLILASSSPRRRELLALLSMPFEVVEPNMDEASVPLDGSLAPEAIAERLAEAKAKSVPVKVDSIAIGADTIVVLEKEILGKPKDAQDAERMLRLLLGREHSVITGVAVSQGRGGKELVSHVSTKVAMRRYSDKEMADYIASGDPFDKAGAYAIQDPLFHPVAEIDGCYMNVVGLPLCLLSSLLIQSGTPVTWKPPVEPKGCSFCAAPLSRLKKI